MWGNALGWRISAVMFVVAIGAGLWLRVQMQITDPTSLALDPKNMAALSPPMPNQPIVAQDRSGDAGDNYSKASAMYQEDQDSCDEWAAKPDGPPPPAVQLIIDATRLSAMNLFDKSPGEVIDYQSEHPNLDSLVKLGQEMEAAAMRLKLAGKNDDARKLLFAGYALGANLLRERVDYDEYLDGMGLMNGATDGLAELEPAGSAKQQMLSAQSSTMSDFNQQNVDPIYKVLSSIDPEKIAENAGDVFCFATRAGERMFRVEAILKLGRYRFNSARQADQLAAPRFLQKLQSEPDPVIRAAASAAAGLTVEQYRMIH
jgi:hypothetical protein